MSTITVEIEDDRKRDLLLALLAELDFVRVITKDAPGPEPMPSVVEEAGPPPWKGRELQLKPARTYDEVVREQGNKSLRFDELVGSWETDVPEVSLAEMLEAAK